LSAYYTATVKNAKKKLVDIVVRAVHFITTKWSHFSSLSKLGAYQR